MRQKLKSLSSKSLNPCCNGIYSMRKIVELTEKKRLNPCCNGIYSMRVITKNEYNELSES